MKLAEITYDDKSSIIPSSEGQGARVIKNWLPLVLGPAFAMDRIPAPVCFSSGLISSSNFLLKHYKGYTDFMLEMQHKIRLLHALSQLPRCKG